MINLYGFNIDPDGWFGISDVEWFNKNTALIIVDMQNYDTNRCWNIIGTEGSGTSPGSFDYYYDRIENIIIPNLKTILLFFRDKNLMIIHVRIASLYKDLVDMPDLWKLRMYQHQRDSCRKYDSYYESEEMQIIDGLKPLENEIEIIKSTGNAFTSTNLDFILRNKGIKSLVIGGAWLNSCVEDTVRVGADLGYLITLLEDGAVAPDKEYHLAATRVLGAMYCNVKDTNNVIKILNKNIHR